MNDTSYEIRIQLEGGGYFLFATTFNLGYAQDIAKLLMKTEGEATIWEVEVKRRQVEKYGQIVESGD